MTIEAKKGDLGQLTGSNRDLVVGAALMKVRSELNIHADRIRAVFLSEGSSLARSGVNTNKQRFKQIQEEIGKGVNK